jgi:hypothetical protein
LGSQRKRAARMGRNPGTGEAIKIKASKKIAFRASKDLKEAVMQIQDTGPGFGGGFSWYLKPNAWVGGWAGGAP